MIDIKVRRKKEKKKSIYILGYFLASYHETLAISNFFIQVLPNLGHHIFQVKIW
jgi:hypothetical protein